MKKIISVMVLVSGTTFQAIAQQEPVLTNTANIFEMPAGEVNRRFTVDLGKGNTMQVELSDIADLDRFANIDSLLRVFLQDIIPLQDSLADELAAKRIDYVTDDLGRKKIHIRVFKPLGSAYILQSGEIASLKTEQDTVNFFGSKPYTERSTLLKPFTVIRYYRLSFFVNRVSDLHNYLDAGLNEKITGIRKNANARWIKDEQGRWHIKKGDQSIYSNHQPAGFVGNSGDYLTVRGSVNIQNYKNYFVPSASLGMALVLNNGHTKRDLGLFWEPHFSFSKNTAGKLHTFRNDFITLTYGQMRVRKNMASKENSFLPIFSLGYLVNRKGDHFEKNTWKLGAGQVSLFNGKIKIEPVIYFNDLFKGVTPGLRLMLGN